MSDLPRYLRDLEEALLDLPDDTDAMLLSELDGYVVGLTVLPADIPSEEWLPAIWRPNPETPDYLYHDQSLLDDIGRLAAQHFRMVARDLHRGEFEPIYDIDGRNDDILWENWISGFDRAMALRPTTFEAIDAADEETLGALGVLMALAMLAGGEPDAAEGEAADPADAELTLGKEEREALTAQAPDLIPELVAVLYDWTRASRPAPDFAVAARRQQIGRNDPCPCGSGKKYKKCCGASA